VEFEGPVHMDIMYRRVPGPLVVSFTDVPNFPSARDLSLGLVSSSGRMYTSSFAAKPSTSSRPPNLVKSYKGRRYYFMEVGSASIFSN
jgi:hypothetical protein